MADEVTLEQGALRRLARLQARSEGAMQVAQAAYSAAQQAQGALQEALTEECRDQGMTIPVGAQGSVDVDWKTGLVRLAPPPGSLPPPGPMPEGNGAGPVPSQAAF